MGTHQSNIRHDTSYIISTCCLYSWRCIFWRATHINFSQSVPSIKKLSPLFCHPGIWNWWRNYNEEVWFWFEIVRLCAIHGALRTVIQTTKWHQLCHKMIFEASLWSELPAYFRISLHNFNQRYDDWFFFLIRASTQPSKPINQFKWTDWHLCKVQS